VSGGVLWGITPMPCILAYAVGVNPVGFTASPGGLVAVFPLGCPWHHIVGSCGGGVVSCAGVDGLYEALPFRQCRAFFLGRCGWAGWVWAWWCILCRSVVPVVVVRGVSCGAVRGIILWGRVGRCCVVCWAFAVGWAVRLSAGVGLVHHCAVVVLWVVCVSCAVVLCLWRCCLSRCCGYAIKWAVWGF